MAALLNGHAAFDAEEAKEVDVQVGGGFDLFAFAAFEVKGFAAVGAGLDGQCRGACAGVVDHLVYRLAGGVQFVGFVDGNTDVAGSCPQAFDAGKAQGPGRGLQAGPGARGVRFAAEQGQRKFGVTQGQAFGLCVEFARLVIAAVDAHKGAHAFAAHRQGIHCHLFGWVRAHRLQGHGFAGLF